MRKKAKDDGAEGNAALLFPFVDPLAVVIYVYSQYISLYCDLLGPIN